MVCLYDLLLLYAFKYLLNLNCCRKQKVLIKYHRRNIVEYSYKCVCTNICLYVCICGQCSVDTHSLCTLIHINAHLNFFSSAAAAYYTDFFLSLFGNVVIGSAFRMLNSLIWLMLSMRCCCSCYYCCRCRCCYCCCYYNFDMRPLPQLRNLFFTILLLFTFRIHLRTHGHTYIETHAHTPIVYTYTNTRAFTQISHFFLLLVPLLISN